MNFFISLMSVLVMLLAVCPVRAQNPARSADKQVQMLRDGTRLVEAKKPQEAITDYFDKVLAHFDSRYRNSQEQIFCARNSTESLFYLQKAVNEKKRARVISSTWADTHFAKGYALLELGRKVEAKASIEKALVLSPSNSRYLSELGYIYQQEKNWPKALETYQASEEAANLFSAPDLKTLELLRAKRGLGYVLVELNRLDEAEEKYRQCLELDKNDQKTMAELQYIQGLRNKNNFYQPKLPPGANQVKDPQQAFKGGMGIYLVKEGFDLLGKGKNEEAVKTFNEAIKLKPDYAEAHEGLGRAYGNLKRWPEAIASYQQAIRLAPDFWQAQVGIGFAYSLVDRNQESINAFKEAVRINPNLGIAHWGLATNYLQLGDRNAALQEHKIMQTLDPDLAKKFEKYLYPPAK